MASKTTNLNINQNRNDESGKSENFEDGDFLALKSNYNRESPTHNTDNGKRCEQKLAQKIKIGFCWHWQLITRAHGDPG